MWIAAASMLRGALLLLVAGCATPKIAAPTPAGGERAVRAFVSLCFPLEERAIGERAGRFAFIPFGPRPGTPFPAALQAPGVRSWVQASGGIRSLLIWNSAIGQCELAVGGVVGEAAEREFGLLEKGLREGGFSVTSIPIPANTPGLLQPRRAILIGPPPLTAGEFRTMVLRVGEQPGLAFNVGLAMRRFTPGAAPMADDAVPVN